MHLRLQQVLFLPSLVSLWSVLSSSSSGCFVTAFRPITTTTTTTTSWRRHQPTTRRPMLQQRTSKLSLLPISRRRISSTASSSSSSSSLSSSAISNNDTEVLEIPDQPPDRRELQSPVTTFTTVEECLNSMDESTSDLTVILFFAHYCKKCHQANIPYKRLAYSNPDTTFTRLETSLMTSQQLKSLGVSRVPFLQIYRNGICVASFATPWKLETQLADTLELCQRRSVSDWLAFCQQHDNDIQSNKQTRQHIREEYSSLSSSSSFMEQQQSQSVKTLASERQLLMAIDRSRSSSKSNSHTDTNDSKNDDDDGFFNGSTIGRGDTRSTTSASEGRTAVIMFHSHFGRSSMRAQHQFRRIAEHHHQQRSATTTNGNNKDKVKDFYLFARMESSTISETTLQELGVSKYPHIQVYRDGKCVASFSIPQTYLFSKMVSDALDELDTRSPEDWEQFMAHHQDVITENQHVIESIRQRQVEP
jgi:hypothetical protein